MTATNQPPSSLFHLTWPLFIDLAFHFLTGALNTFMVGQVSYQSVAALAVGNQILDLCITLFNFIGIGSSVVIAQYLGAGDKRMTRRVVHTAIGFNLLVGLVTALVVIFGADGLLHLMNMPENLMRDGHVYLTVIGLCLLFLNPAALRGDWSAVGSSAADGAMFWLPWPIGGVLCGVAALAIQLVKDYRERK